MNTECCNRIRQIKVGGAIYNYVLKCNLIDCTENWCNKRRAIIEIAPHKFAQIHSDKDITEKDIENEIKRQKRNEV